MMPVRIPADAKPAYHAGAAIVANYTVALRRCGRAARRGRRGCRRTLPRGFIFRCSGGTVANLTALGPAAALTGPVRRGDVQTIRATSPPSSPEDRELYRRLAPAAVLLAREAGLETGQRSSVDAVL